MWSIWEYFSGILEYLAPFWFRNRKCVILFLGLDNAGKTTFMGRLKEDRMVQAKPTLLPYSESLQYHKTTFTAYDLGGQEQVRRVWKDYYPVADGIVFIIDATDHERFGKSASALDGILSDDDVKESPVAVLVNKIDKPSAYNRQAIMDLYHLNGLTTGPGKLSEDELQGRRPLEVFETSILHRQGYGEAIKWLSHYIK